MVQIWTDDTYVYAATSSGLSIVDIVTKQQETFVTSASGYNTVWVDDDYIFLGSSNYGIQILLKSYIGLENISDLVINYAQEPFLTSNNVKYLHGNTNRLICCTSAGVDIIRRGSSYITNTTIISGVATKCFVTPDYDYYYYIVENTNDSNWALNRLNGNTSNWTSPDITYTTGAGFLAEATCLNDFFVTEHTSLSGVNNTLFVATISGVYVYDEGTTDYLLLTTVS